MNKQNKWLLGLVAVLILVNLLLVILVFRSNKNFDQANSASKDFLVKELNLSSHQQIVLDSVRQVYFQTADAAQGKINFIKNRLYSLIKKKES